MRNKNSNIKPMPTHILPGMNVVKHFHKLVIALTFLWSMGSWFWTPTRYLQDTLHWVLGRNLTPWQYLWEATAQDPLEKLLPNPCNHHWYGAKLNECNHLNTILFPPSKFYHASAPVQLALAPEQPKILSCVVATCKTIGNCPSNKLLKVFTAMKNPCIKIVKQAIFFVMRKSYVFSMSNNC